MNSCPSLLSAASAVGRDRFISKILIFSIIITIDILSLYDCARSITVETFRMKLSSNTSSIARRDNYLVFLSLYRQLGKFREQVHTNDDKANSSQKKYGKKNEGGHSSQLSK